MGGDHKCPVCQATFTRPQHVARHMRSHTGDRPYKCQHCGDQFARSDLLSRHVNKCHAAEKSLLSSSSSGGMSGGSAGRRKGGTAATRATTSKQACDQCVQSSLPCDGSNPCAKCIARKTRCTFVKFHRQTAPVGPGHPSSLSASHPQSQSASSSSSASASSASSGLAHPSLLGLGLAPLSAPLEQQPFLYAQQAASGVGVGQFAFPHGQHSPGPVFTANASADEGQGRFAHHPGRFGGGSVSPTYPGDYHSHSHSPHRRERDSAYYSADEFGGGWGLPLPLQRPPPRLRLARPTRPAPPLGPARPAPPLALRPPSPTTPARVLLRLRAHVARRPQRPRWPLQRRRPLLLAHRPHGPHAGRWGPRLGGRRREAAAHAAGPAWVPPLLATVVIAFAFRRDPWAGAAGADADAGVARGGDEGAARVLEGVYADAAHGPGPARGRAGAADAECERGRGGRAWGHAWDHADEGE
ncbi:hypothetical protein B0H16DRAFT_200341 [Mycena metata]|uniref:Uncharacterized protein n=1 Tax=Mycena metata TaxID=1033252 RepID=A0AAD7HZP2_9AGAR|nr:hypothetical protein B0H16DRAFT_200341 [Mycena metata]